MKANIYRQFRSSLERDPEKICLSFPEKEYSYQDVFEASSKLSNFLRDQESDYVGILAHRSLSAYIGVLATLQAGKTYVPLNPKLPPAKIEQIISFTNMKSVISDFESLAIIPKLKIDKQLNLLSPEFELDTKIIDFKNTVVIDAFAIEKSIICYDIIDPSNDNVYLLFTTGSTGEPKAIEISHQSLFDYLNYVQGILDIKPTDKCSQIFDLSFDASVHDLFLTWMNGATLCIPEREIFNPIKFVKKNNISVWFSVPSVGYHLLKSNLLESNIFPSIRISQFAGEQLIADFARQWENAAPNSRIENIYGQTEGTVGISIYTWKKGQINRTTNGNVSIGKIFTTQKYLLVDDNDHVLSKNSTGELLISGSQVITRYSFSGNKYDDKFVKISEDDLSIYYRTGDIVHEDADGYLYFAQRSDFEFKINGYRVDEEEVNNAIRKITQANKIVSMPYNDADGRQVGIASFIESRELFEASKIIAECKKSLPHYMVPSKILIIDEMPLNANGKVNRASLRDLLI
jgi:amino acid adenylation domain-containing protein